MEKKNPIRQSVNIKNEFSEYIRSTFDIRNEEYRALFYKELDRMEDSLYKGPYLCSTYPFEKGETIDELSNPNRKPIHLSPNFKKLGGISKISYKLYKHQVDAIDKIEGERNVVITTGTGSGKTECFSYPILDSIIKEIEEGNKESGIRAIFLFPMNALINDQIDRIRILLETYPDIKFGFYTGETPKDDDAKQRKAYEDQYGKKLSDNELVTRQQMRENPPHILFTNYSMLEYLLIRPSDACLVSDKSLKHWKYVVLDEAHTYKGSLGMEIAVLLRRLAGIANKKPHFILTSATLGRGKQDINKIIDFAESLTSSSFEKDDIIFAQRHPLPLTAKYSLMPEEYIELFDKVTKKESIVSIYEKYADNYDDSLSTSQNLYELLKYDKNVHDLYSLSQSGESFFVILRSMPLLKMNVEALVALIELISKSTSKDDYKLYDVKYHMFIKAPDGAFITLGKNKQLSLVSCQTIGNKKAFKIGICQNCKTPYVMGIIENDILSIDDEVDIDEEFMVKQKRIGYYLIKDCLTDSEISKIEADKEHYKKYYVCPIYGHIRADKDAKGKKCDCGIEEETVLYAYREETIVEDDEDLAFSNNIKSCPICDFHTNTGGVVMGFHIGKDRATALISQILYRNMDYPVETKKQVGVSIFGNGGDVEVKGVKQFIAFSDARQQAAFFNKFSNANDDRFLKKALIWNILNSKENQNKPISFTDLVTKLTEKMENELYYDHDEAHKHARAGALWELLNVDGRNSAEGLGLFGFILNLPPVYDNKDAIESFLQQKGFNNISCENFKTLTKVALSEFRTVPAIRYPQLSSNNAELEDLLGYRRFVNFVELETPKGSKKPANYEGKVKSFLPVNVNTDNKIIEYTKKAFSITSSDKAKELLRIVYGTVRSPEAGIVVSNEDQYDQIDSKSYSVHSYKNTKFYYCKKCHKVTFYNINGKCTDGDCDGELVEINPDVLFEKNYYRNEYMNRPLERVVSREHTAQIKSAEAKKIQQDFKDKKINIISCSTTFEMGIDLDKLNTVFMRNIPPSPANYVQRAGRAGRRADSSAFILTFCSVSSHDYTFFSDPRDMIAGMVEPPHFRVDNDKIIIRHITASALGFYFRNNIESFNSIRKFIDEDHIQKFIDYIGSKPKQLGDYIDNCILITPYLMETYSNFKWAFYLETSSKSALNNLKDGINETIQTYEDAIKTLLDEKPKGFGALIDQYKDAIDRLNYKNSIIQYLARYNVIPRYGFPIDNVSLKIFDRAKADFSDKYDLTRDLSIAISEYAPESEVIVDGKKYTSRYIYTPYPNAPQTIEYYHTCGHCKSINIYQTKQEANDATICEYCHEPINVSKQDANEYIRPLRGFVAGPNKATRRLKPMRSYASDVMYIGHGTQTIDPIDINGVLTITEYKNEELLVLNENKFYYCSKCGYTVLDRDNKGSVKIKTHNDYRGNPCDNSELKLTHFGHRYRTDVVKIEFTGVSEMLEQDHALSTLYALLEGISVAFDIDRSDIGGMIVKMSPLKPYELILFDTVSGGAGHVKKLESKENIIKALQMAKQIVTNCICDEETSCYNCLKNFNNQRIHNHLKRGYAKETISNILDLIKKNCVSYTVKNVYYPLPHGLSSFDLSNLETDEDKYLLQQLILQMSGQICSEPDGYGITLENPVGDVLDADFYWKDKNILLFTLEHLDSYHKLYNGQSKYECYLLDEHFNIVGFVNRIKKGL